MKGIDNIGALVRDLGKDILSWGLIAVMLVAGEAVCKVVCKKIIPPSTIEYAKITEATFDRQATIAFLGPNYILNKAVFIYDLDGKKDSSGQRTAEEAFECPYRYSVYEGTYMALTHVPVSKWKHYVAPDAKNLLVLNNITPMTDEQREFYSKILNMYQKKINQK